jgi:hypothetical protein
MRLQNETKRIPKSKSSQSSIDLSFHAKGKQSKATLNQVPLGCIKINVYNG